MSPASHPPVPHYDRGKVQLIDFLEASMTPEEYAGFLKGQVFKYLTRYRFKGSPIADLMKATVYLDWLVEFEEKRK